MNLIEQLEALPQVLAGEGPFYDICVKLSDVRAIIEQHKSDMGVNLQLQIAPTVLLSKDFFRLSKDDGVLIQSWLNSAYEQIAEQHKSEAVEPVEYQIKILGERWTRCAKHIYDPNNPNTRALYTTPQPDIVSELVEAFEHSRACLEAANNSGLINDTLWAGNAETLFDYMDAAIAKAKEMMG